MLIETRRYPFHSIVILFLLFSVGGCSTSLIKKDVTSQEALIKQSDFDNPNYQKNCDAEIHAFINTVESKVIENGWQKNSVDSDSFPVFLSKESPVWSGTSLIASLTKEYAFAGCFADAYRMIFSSYMEKKPASYNQSLRNEQLREMRAALVWSKEDNPKENAIEKISNEDEKLREIKIFLDGIIKRNDYRPSRLAKRLKPTGNDPDVGFTLLAKKRYTYLIEQFQAKEKKNFYDYLQIGTAYQKLNDDRNAVAALHHAEETLPAAISNIENIVNRCQLAIMFFRANDYADALRNLDLAENYVRIKWGTNGHDRHGIEDYLDRLRIETWTIRAIGVVAPERIERLVMGPQKLFDWPETNPKGNALNTEAGYFYMAMNTKKLPDAWKYRWLQVLEEHGEHVLKEQETAASNNIQAEEKENFNICRAISQYAGLGEFYRTYFLLQRYGCDASTNKTFQNSQNIPTIFYAAAQAGKLPAALPLLHEADMGTYKEYLVPIVLYFGLVGDYDRAFQYVQLEPNFGWNVNMQAAIMALAWESDYPFPFEKGLTLIDRIVGDRKPAGNYYDFVKNMFWAMSKKNGTKEAVQFMNTMKGRAYVAASSGIINTFSNDEPGASITFHNEIVDGIKETTQNRNLLH